jgi:subtilisin family serine protease
MVKACGFLWTKYCSAYGQMAGTSMAAPEVAGIAALVRAEHPGFTAAQVAACITDTAGSGPAGIASFRSDLPTSFKPKIPYEPTTLPIVDAPNAVACTGRPPAATDALVVGTGDFGDVNADDNLTSLLTNAGYHVTETQSLPDDLTPYDSLWYVSTDPLSTDDGIRIAQFAKSGHGVFLTGERPCCEALNAWDSAIVNQLVVSVGGVTVGGLGDPFYDTGDVTIHADAASDVAQKPNMLSTWRVSAPGGLDNVASQNVFADASGVPVAAVWGSADVIGSGRLALLMDVNWLEDGYWDPVSAKSIVENLALFLSGASQPPAAPAGRATAVRRATSRSHTPSAAGP